MEIYALFRPKEEVNTETKELMTLAISVPLESRPHPNYTIGK